MRSMTLGTRFSRARWHAHYWRGFCLLMRWRSHRRKCAQQRSAAMEGKVAAAAAQNLNLCRRSAHLHHNQSRPQRPQHNRIPRWSHLRQRLRRSLRSLRHNRRLRLQRHLHKQHAKVSSRLLRNGPLQLRRPRRWRRVRRRPSSPRHPHRRALWPPNSGLEWPRLRHRHTPDW